MTSKNISILIEDRLEVAALEYVRHPATLQIKLEDGWTKKFSGLDLYECLGKIIKERPDIKFLCKGAKISVRPSSMSSQMSSGIVAYEHKLGIEASRKDIVNIFDYEDQDIINDPQKQTDYFFCWLESIKNGSH
ncbi:hypothetical protein [Pseudomonas izuensis]|uniref:hypothetical protein n=1 Tax=Pseudomonas izuensis TaxID=2684212 RepID=UPI00135C0963|nr:hypothetical protein [Pseudomonas izuensis]